MNIAVVVLVEFLEDKYFIKARPFLKALELCKKHKFRVFYYQTSNIPSARNVACALHMHDNAFVMQWDSDQVWKVEEAVQMVDTAIEKKIHIISPAITRNGSKDVICAGFYVDEPGVATYINNGAEYDLVEVDYLGDGGILTSSEALKATAHEEWFRQHPVKENGVLRFKSWDHGFCVYMANAGYKLYLYNSLKVKHFHKIKRTGDTMGTEKTEAATPAQQQGMRLDASSFLRIKERTDEALVEGNALYKTVFNQLATVIVERDKLKKTVAADIATIAGLKEQVEDLKKGKKATAVAKRRTKK